MNSFNFEEVVLDVINNINDETKKKELKNKNIKVKSLVNIKYLKDTSYDLFNEIF